MARDEAEDVLTGKRFRASYLVEQADYTEALAKKELSLLSPLGITKPVMDSLADLKSKLNAAMKDRSLAAADSQAATTTQNTAIGKAKSWLRKAILIGKNAYDDDRAQADEFSKGGATGNSVPKLATKIKAVSGLLKRETTLTSTFGATTAFLKEGEDLLGALSASDATQENKKADMPKATKEFYLQKAHLYFLLKRINRAGQIAHMDDQEAAAKYNLSILHRRGAPRKAKEEATAGTA